MSKTRLRHAALTQRLLLADDFIEISRGQRWLCIIRVALGAGDEAFIVGQGLLVALFASHVKDAGFSPDVNDG